MTVNVTTRPGGGGGWPHFANRGVAEAGGLDWRNWLKGGGEFLSLGRRLGYNWDTTDCAFMVRKHNIRRFQK